MNRADDEPGLAERLDRALGEHFSAASVLDRELADLLEVAHCFETSAAQVTPSAAFRATARQRLLLAMARSTGAAMAPRVSVGDRVRAWFARFAVGLAALGFIGASAATASANALPGDLFYPVKQATEAVALQSATSDAARDEVLLSQADTRLDEAARLLQQGRAGDVATTAARYDDTLAALTATPRSERVKSDLQTKQDRLSELLQTAPGPARAGLERALAATERSRGRSRPTVPASTPESVDSVTTQLPEPRQTGRPSDTVDHRTIESQASPSASAGESDAGESRDSHADARAPDVRPRPPAAHGQRDAGLLSAESSSGESTTLHDGHSAPHANAQPAPPSPGRTTGQQSAVPRPGPGGRSRS